MYYVITNALHRSSQRACRFRTTPFTDNSFVFCLTCAREKIDNCVFLWMIYFGQMRQKHKFKGMMNKVFFMT